jgi:hypothetical protein
VDAHVGAVAAGVVGIRSTQQVAITYDANAGDSDGFVDVALGTTVVNQGKALFLSPGAYTNTQTSGVPDVGGVATAHSFQPSWSFNSGTSVRGRFHANSIASGGVAVTVTHTIWVVEFY